MNVKDILKIKSLSEAKLQAGKNGLSNQIRGINVIEAIDIENWGQPGEVLLTSFFAFQNVSDNEVDMFFEKLHKIGISSLIIKVDRLVHQIPDRIIELCDKYLIPLIQIGKNVKYETIILEIMGPIVDRNVYLLNKYYETHSELTSLALKMPTMEEILKEFKKMLQRDVSLINSVKGTEISTNPNLCDATLLSTVEVMTEKYMQFKYYRKEVIYNKIIPNIVGMQIRVRIPYVGYGDYELVIHEIDDQINSEDFMVLENGVKFLQMELLKKYVISQNLFQQKNNLLSDLLNDRLYDEKDVDEVLETLNLTEYKYYQIILIRLHPHDENKKLDSSLFPQILRLIRIRFKFSFINTAYLEKLDRIVFLLNLSEEQKGFEVKSIEKIMAALSENILFEYFNYYISISSKVEKFGISKANREVLDTQKVLKLFNNSNIIMPYEELGIYKLFLETASLGELEKFVSPKIKNFREEYPQLFDTLTMFLDTNQSFVVTSEKLFLHTKTVRYRIDKIKEILGIDFANPEEILQIQVASRLFKLLDGRKKSE